MKPISIMTPAELAAYVQTCLREKRIEGVLSGGATVSIYNGNRYVSRDLDQVILFAAKRQDIRQVRESIGFREVGRHYEHPETDLFVEFPPGPLSVGTESVGNVDEFLFDTGLLRII